jgi:hypothetical protein
MGRIGNRLDRAGLRLSIYAPSTNALGVMGTGSVPRNLGVAHNARRGRWRANLIPIEVSRAVADKQPNRHATIASNHGHLPDLVSAPGRPPQDHARRDCDERPGHDQDTRGPRVAVMGVAVTHFNVHL